MTPGVSAGSRLSIGDAVLVVVRSQPGVWRLEDVLLGERDAPVVLLTQSLDTLEPVLSPEKVSAIVGSEAAIYYLPGDYLLTQLRATLGHALAVSRGAARIFWPGLSSRSDPADHPLIPVLDGEAKEDALTEFARQCDLSRPSVRREINLIEDTRSVLQSELDTVRGELRTTAEQLRDANVERHQAIMRAERAEDRLGPEGQLSARSCEEALHLLIVREWLGAFLPADRREHPLGAYVLAPELLAAVEGERDLAHRSLAWVCAMVACGYAPALAGVAPRLLPAGRDGSPLERADGARAWCCNLKSEVAGGSRLHYWIRREGTVEFAAVSLEALNASLREL